MNYRETFILRAVELLKAYKGHLPPDVRNIVTGLSADRKPNSLTSEEFNALQEIAERIETAQRLRCDVHEPEVNALQVFDVPQ